jgi:competence protein ComEC
MIWAYVALGIGASMFLFYLSTRRTQVLFVVLCLCFLIFGMVRAVWVDPVRTPEVDIFVGQKTEVIGTIARDPDRRSNGTQYVLTIERVSGAIPERPVLLLANLPRYPEYEVGDKLTLEGVITPPKDFETDPTRPPFSYIKYLAKDGIGYVMRFPSVMEAKHTNQFFITHTLSGWKRAIIEKGNEIFPEPEGGLLAGMLLGERHAMPSDILDEMRVAGLVHIIVVSGYNMTVVAEAVSKLFGILPLLARSGIGLLVVWIYAGMVSGGAPVLRAAIMTSFALIARMTGNTSIALRLLYLSAIIMVFQNPRIALDDPSFHLSFLATLGLIVLSPKIGAWLSGNAKKTDKKTHTPLPWWKELFSATVSAQLMVMPYILFFSGQLSPYALPANLLALPAVPIAMGLGTFSLILSAVIPFAGTFLGWIASIPAWWVIVVGTRVSHLPGSSILFPIPLWGSLLLYGLGLLLFFKWRKGNGIDVSKE